MSKNDWKLAKNVWNDLIAKLIFTESSHKRYHASNAWTDSDTTRRKVQQKGLTTNCSKTFISNWIQLQYKYLYRAMFWIGKSVGAKMMCNIRCEMSSYIFKMRLISVLASKLNLINSTKKWWNLNCDIFICTQQKKVFPFSTGTLLCSNIEHA